MSNIILQLYKQSAFRNLNQQPTMERKVDIDKNNSLVALGMYAWYMCVCACVCMYRRIGFVCHYCFHWSSVYRSMAMTHVHASTMIILFDEFPLRTALFHLSCPLHFIPCIFISIETERHHSNFTQTT